MSAKPTIKTPPKAATLFLHFTFYILILQIITHYELRIDFAAKADALMCLNEFPNGNSIHGAQREFMAKPIHDNVVVNSF